MADTLIARSPLQDYESRFATLPDTVSLTEEPYVVMVDLWADPSDPGGAAAATAVGIAGLPVAPSTVVDGPDTSVIWFGPQEWLVTSTTRGGEELETQLREAIGDHSGAAVDVSAQRTTLRLRGARARDVLAKGCSLDLHPSVFTVGAAAQTMLGLAAVVLIPLDDAGTDYRIIVRSSFARYLADWLLDAATEYSVAW
ncbi:sarcosine oxidase subunit gamma [Gordonia rhizosphera]|uniref:Sarcosine oxidase gamma subunit n=1 Tax=Gordonia rhizosphera NBRC 16068 TaxID=1108045 RepID=K6X2G2_9ACTN|nr:sarcosine oxidase subunit gamma family protein [Gordonia rhizosphera]GAB92989.1 sarcosine oxidase gamma subunit [Gordonia rhizosphera NBRC 16068]